VWRQVGSSLWFVPVVCVFAGVGLSFGTIALDRLADGSVVPRSLSGDPQAALAVLTTVAASMVTLTALVLTITMVVVQLAMGQFTPRVLRTILRDRPSQLAIGVFVATFVHAMLVMREVRASGDEGNVPGLAIVVSFVLIIVSIVVLVWYVHHIGQSLKVASLIDSVGDDARRLLDRLHPPAARTKLTQQDGVIAAIGQGVVIKLDPDALVGEAQRADAVIKLLRGLGDFVPRGAPLFEVRGGSRVDREALLRAVALGNERTLDEDLAYGFRLLVDVSVRAVSEAMSDPSTATQAIDRIHDLLRQLANRPLPNGRHLDDHGELRLLVPTLSWDGYVRLAVDELRIHGRHSVQVTRRLEAMLNDLLEVAPPERCIVLEHELRLLESAVPTVFDAHTDRRAATTPDQQGIGSGADVLVDPPSQLVTDGSRR
jgi:uncharacterized membrane protein